MTKRKAKRLTPAQRVEIVERYAAGENSRQLAEVYGVTDVAVRATIKRLGGTIRSPREAHQRYSLDETVLDDPLTDAAAYWVGFLMADGYVDRPAKESSQRFGVALAKKDKEHVQNLASFFGSDAPLQPKAAGHGAFLWSCRSDYLCRRLASFGVVPAKSRSASPSPSVSCSRHFWRGMWDGDGQVGKGNGCPLLSLIGSYPMIYAFVDWAKTQLNDYPLKPRGHRNTTVTAGIQLHGDGAMRLLRLLYGDLPDGAPSLRRKKELADSLLEKYKGRNFRVFKKIAKAKEQPPYHYKCLSKALSSFEQLVSYNPSKDVSCLIKHSMQGALCHEVAKRRIGVYASHYFHERERLSVRVMGQPSPLEIWADLDERQLILEDAESRKHSSLRASWFAHCRAAWGFSPAVAKAVYRFFGASSVFDPCAGWGDRLTAALACPGMRYVGVDPNPKTVPVYERILSAYQECTTATGVVHQSAVEDLPLSKSDDPFDLVFTSPPYFNLEAYSNDDRQSCVRYQTPGAWRTGFLQPLIAKSLQVLRPGGVLAINISTAPSPEGALPLPEWLIQDGQEAGLLHTGVILMQTANFTRGREGIYCFRKPTSPAPR